MTRTAGFILINKPVGPSSHAIINRLRRLSGQKRIGHAGTLDPLASGLLIVAIGREFTKQLGRYLKADKEYRADIYLGAISHTYDREGPIQETVCLSRPKRSDVKKALLAWQGKIEQTPPLFSAKKIGGQKLYQLARKGLTISIPAQSIEIYRLKLIRYRWPHLVVKISCSSGTYIRSLAHDLGQTLGCGAYLYSLTRTKIGRFSLRSAKKLEKLNADNVFKYLKNSL